MYMVTADYCSHIISWSLRTIHSCLARFDLGEIRCLSFEIFFTAGYCICRLQHLFDQANSHRLSMLW